jgi:hypothetical protein
MSNPSNLYAEKVYAEQPNALWSLDDKADYISLISENDRKVYNWNVQGATVSLDNSLVYNPFPDSDTTKIIAELPEGAIGEIVLVSDDILNFSSLNTDLSTFSIGSYVYAKSVYLTDIKIGYEYFDTTTGQTVQKLKDYNTSVSENWLFVSETFSIPSDNTTMRLVLKIGYVRLDEDPENYIFYQNGFTLGQWSENFNSVSLGVNAISIPSDIAIPASTGLEAKVYGLSENPGYYFVNDNALIAKNVGLPLVFGSSNVTKILPNGDKPSLILPGLGFLNQLGKYKDYTLEFWLRANSDAVVKKRIVGPIGSDDGIYVDGPFIILKIRDNYASHYVGQWERPMLINVRVGNNGASLVINGEQVVALDYITEELDFPSEFNESGKNQDWIGFYAYEDVSPIEIDCVAIYPYQVPLIVSKRRFVYGQGVEFPENINTAYSGTSVYIDYPFADYTNNYIYPDMGRWSQGTVENLNTDQNTLSIPSYELPSLNFSDKTSVEFYSDNDSAQNEDELFITYRPNESWGETQGYMLLNNFNLLNSQTDAFYGVFKVLSFSESTETLIRLEDSNTGNYFSIDLVNNLIEYKLKYGADVETVYTSSTVFAGNTFGVGLNIQAFSDYYGANVASFFGNRSSLNVYIGGTKNMAQTFTGNIYRVSLCSESNLYQIDYLFNEFGVPKDYENMFNNYDSFVDYDGGTHDQTFWEYVLDGGSPDSFVIKKMSEHSASYSLVPKSYFEDFSLDVDVRSYWEDNIPLTYFAQYTEDAKGDQRYSLDFLQFNIDYPAPSSYSEESQEDSWTYQELSDQYQNPVQRNYDLLANYLFTGYNDYDDLKNKSSKSYKYDTSTSIVKTYITFQYTVTGANSGLKSFPLTISAPKNGIVKPGPEWVTTKYEVVDNMIIYPPVGIDFKDLSITTHIDFDVKGVTTSPVKIRSMQYASQAFNSSSPNAIGTRFGIPIYPYKKSGAYYSYKDVNPFSIYKGSSPYLYLTRNSGIQLRGDYDPFINRGLSIPINAEKADSYKIIAMQAMLRFDEDFFPYSPTQILEVESKGSIIKFYMVANDRLGKRAKIYAINQTTGLIENGIAFYWNGNLVKEPVMTIKEWGMLGVSFSNILDFSNAVGSIRVNGPVLINNISHYQSTNLQEVQRITKRPWFKVKYAGAQELEWDFWNSAYVWQGVLVVASTSYYGVNPTETYKSFTGTNKIIVDDDRVFGINGYEYSVYQDAIWLSTTSNAV